MADRRGGRREGAGRKKQTADLRQATVFLEKRLIEELDRIRGTRSRSSLISEAVAQWLNKEEGADE